MELIPSIDLRRGRVVRLTQGRWDRETVYFEEPLEALARFQAAGAERVHIVDLDAAFGEPRQRTALARLVAGAKREQLQTGGGLRTEDDVADALGSGFDRVVLASLPAQQPERFAALAKRFAGRLIPAWEVAGGELRIAGWQSTNPLHRTLFSAALRALTPLLPAILVTDIDRDGTLSGANVELAVAVARAVALPALVSGGVAAVEDVEVAAARPEIAGLIVGRAFYEGRIDLRQAIQAARAARGAAVS